MNLREKLFMIANGKTNNPDADYHQEMADHHANQIEHHYKLHYADKKDTYHRKMLDHHMAGRQYHLNKLKEK